MKGLGMQLTTRYRSGSQSVLIEGDQIDSVIINEAITMHRVIFYLAFVVKDKNNLAVAFAATRPRLNVLKLVYRDAHSTMTSTASE
jgi:GPI-GlcNAc transferase complex, PIG-H component